MAWTVAELIWLIGLFKELGAGVEVPVKLFCDNKIALQIAANPAYHKRTKHIELDCHFIREKIQKGIVKTVHVSSKEQQQADILTKALLRSQHEYILSKLGVLNRSNLS